MVENSGGLMLVNGQYLTPIMNGVLAFEVRICL